MKFRKLTSLLLAAAMTSSALSFSSVTADDMTTEDGFKYKYWDNGIAITKYTGKAENVVIPDQIEGKNIVRIESYAFQNNKTMKNIHIPDTVSTMGSCSFQNCTALESVVLPKSLKKIETDDFENCSSLRSVYIQDNTSSLGLNPFYGCENIKIYLSCGSKCTTDPTYYYYYDPLDDDDVIPPPENMYIIKEEHNYIDDPETGGKICTKCSDISEPEDHEKMYLSLDISDVISLNFSNYKGKFKDEGAYAIFTFNNGTVKKIARTDTKYNSKFIVDLDYTQMNDKFKAQIFYSNGTKSKQFTLSVNDYLMNSLNDVIFEDESAICKRLKDLGAYIDIYSGDMNNTPITDLTNVNVNIPNNYAAVKKGNNIDGVNVESAYLSIGKYMSLNTKFKVDGDINNYTFKVNDEEVAPIITEDGFVRIKAKNIAPREYDNIYKFTVSDGTKTFEFDYSPMTYIKNKLASKTASTELKNVCKALYNYNQAAEEYYY